MAQKATTTEKKEYKYKIATATVELPSGEHKQIKAYGKTKREAESKLKVKRAQIEQGVAVTNAKTPAMQFFREWLATSKQEGKQRISQATFRDYQCRLENHFDPVFHDLSLGCIKPAHCEQVLARISGNSQSDINKTFQLLKSGLKYAVDIGLISQNPMAIVKRPKGTAGKRRSLTGAEYDRVRRAIEAIMADPEGNHAAAAYVAIALGCGCRPGEVAALRWSNIKLGANPTLTVAGAVKKNTFTIGEPKTEAGRRTVGIPSWLADILRQYKAERAEAIKAANDKREKDIAKAGLDLHIAPDNVEFSLLFPSHHVDSRPLSEGSRRFYWATVRDMAAIPADVDLYVLRHTYCTRGAKAGVDLRTMRYLMGHESIEITAKIYTEITDEMQMDASAAIEALDRMERQQRAESLS